MPLFSPRVRDYLTTKVSYYHAYIHNKICEGASNEINSYGLFTKGAASHIVERLAPPISRKNFINEIMHSDGLILEIGPYHNPALKGNNVRYFDVFSQQELLKKAKIDNVDKSRIPEIHYVSPIGDMGIITEKFDVIFSSHNIEHQVDLIRHLKEASKLLKPHGKYYMAIPDKRYCFDHFIPETAMSDVITTHYENRSSHDLKAILTMRCETTHNNSYNHHINDNGNMAGADYVGYTSIDTDRFHLKDNLECYQKAYKEFLNSKGKYIDSHKWRFTPANFYFILEALYKLGYISFKVEKVYKTHYSSNEFYAILKK